MRRSFLVFAFVGALAIGTGEASAQYYQTYPTYPAYPTNCDAYARSYAYQTAGYPAGGVIGGAAVGALAGAGIGAIVGGPASVRRGAAIGAVSGAFIGAASNRWNAAYRFAYNNCVASVRYASPPVVYATPPTPAYPVYTTPSYGRPYPAWSQAWFDYCSNRFQTFDRQTGYYKGFDGQYHFCQG
jgi:hypothetical protein